MKFFFDTEFIEDGRAIDLLSIGIVSEDGREFYCEFDVDTRHASLWVQENVLPHLGNGPVYSRECAAKLIAEFCGEKPEFWAYYASYDWVALCRLFGRMIDVPAGWPMYCRDIKQLCDSLGNPRLLDRPTNAHHALADAYWARDVWDFLERLSSRRGFGLERSSDGAQTTDNA